MFKPTTIKAPERRSRAPIRSIVIVTALLLAAIPSISSAAVGTSIQFLSPVAVGEDDPIVSDKQAANGTYRISAWVSNVPAEPVVEFELIASADSPSGSLNLGTANRVTNDTFELEWDIPDGATAVVDGEYTLKAVLYDGPSGREIASDSQVVMVFHGVAATSAADTVDISYPAAGGSFGMYSASSGPSIGVIDAVQSSKGWINAYYSVSRPGQEPEWILCRDQESILDQPDGIGCQLRGDDPETATNDAHRPPLVTALAVVLTDNSGRALASDATRVSPYAQLPTAMETQLISLKSTDPANSPGSNRQDLDATGAFPCSDRVTVLVLDQKQHRIAGVNIDVHAAGPSDQLKFDTGWLSSPGGTRRNQPPDAVHPTLEPGFKCTSNHDNRGDQGDHGRIGAPDVKHVESIGGTGDSGTFSFRLHSDQVGATEITAWADFADDDVFCSEESPASASIALSWGTDTPSASPVAPVDCSAAPLVRSISLEASRSKVSVGTKVLLAGAISGEAACSRGQTVSLRMKLPSSTRFRKVASLSTDQGGAFKFSVRPPATRDFQVVAPASKSCQRARSENVTVRVRTS